MKKSQLEGVTLDQARCELCVYVFFHSPVFFPFLQRCHNTIREWIFSFFDFFGTTRMYYAVCPAFSIVAILQKTGLLFRHRHIDDLYQLQRYNTV